MRTLVLSILLLATPPAFAAAPLTFEEVDTDGDGLISADEAASVEGLDFNAADGDNDGTLTVDEYDIAVEGLTPPATDDQPGDAEPATPPGPVKAPTPTHPAGGGASTTPAPTTPPASPKP